MNRKLKQTAASLVLIASIISPGYSVYAADGPVPTEQVQAAVIYPLTDVLDVELKSVLNEHILEGTRLGVVIRMKNNSDAITRVPDYELRVKTNEGTEYTLQPSAANVKALQPKANSELSYMAVIDRTDEVTLSEIHWTDVDYYVFPKTETLITSVPITGAVWSGNDMQITDPKSVVKWSDTFKIPSLLSPIQYTPVGLNKESTEQGTVYVVQLLAYNPTAKRETVPNFQIDGKTAVKVFAGKRVEEQPTVLEGQEGKYIHFAIPTDQDTLLESLNVLTKETFVQTGMAQQYFIGRLNIALATAADSSRYPVYTLGDKMSFDSRSELIHPDVNVSLVEFQMHENADEGSRNVTAKYELFNKSDRPIAIPAFESTLVGSDGYEYNGKRQKMATSSLLPNSGMVVGYSFTVPVSETGEGLALKVQDAQMAAPFKTTIASYRVSLQPENKESKFNVYPFEVAVTSWNISYRVDTTTWAYNYKGKFFLDIQRKDAIQVDPNFSQLKFELYDKAGRLVGTATKGFTGPGRLVTGENNLTFAGTSEQFDYPLTVKIYDVFTTTDGSESKRLVAEYTE